jgi:hypothetical protein
MNILYVRNFYECSQLQIDDTMKRKREKYCFSVYFDTSVEYRKIPKQLTS